MTTLSFAPVTCVLLTLSLGSVTAVREPQSSAVEEFTLAVGEYAGLHRRIQQELPTLRIRADAKDIVESTDAFAAAIQSARPRAREGDIFRPAVAAYMRALIAESLAANGFLPNELLASNLEEADEAAPLPVVNGRFPWGRGALMWPCLLDVLLPLPKELQYRFVGRDLVLVDIDADLVVDILRDAVR